MREILFRGKRKQDGMWCHGDLVWLKDGDTQMPHIYYFGEVYPASIGQYTGLTDKNGNKIFEGDIVEFTDKYIHKKGRAKIVFEAFKWKYSGCYYGGNPIVWLCIDDSSIEFEVIGNIHDNPELLEIEK